MKKSVIYSVMYLATMSEFALEGCNPWQMCGEQLSHAPSIQLDMHLQASEEQPSHVPCTPEEKPWDLDFFLEGYNPWQMCEEQPSRASCMQPDMPLQASEEEDPSLADAEHDSLMERRIRRMERRTGRMERRTGRMERRTGRMERRTGRMERTHGT